MNSNKIYIIFVTVTLMLFSCGNQNTIPEGIMSEEKMTDVLTEIEITQALIKLKFSSPDSTINRQQLYNQVYDEFDISEDHFNKSLNYYCEHPKLLEEIYVDVISKLTEKQAKLK